MDIIVAPNTANSEQLECQPLQIKCTYHQSLGHSDFKEGAVLKRLVMKRPMPGFLAKVLAVYVCHCCPLFTPFASLLYSFIVILGFFIL